MARLQPYDPFPEAAFDDLFRTFFQPTARASRASQAAAQQTFRLDVAEDDKGYVVHAELPGVTKDDIQVTIDGHQVTIAAEAKRAERKEGERALHVERYAGSLFRSFTLPTEVDESGSAARYENGILELRLAKKVPQAGRKLSIQ